MVGVKLSPDKNGFNPFIQASQSKTKHNEAMPHSPTFSQSSIIRIFGWFCWPSAKGFTQSGHWAMHSLRVAERDGRGWEPGSCPDSGRGRALIVGMAGPPPRGHPHGRAFRDWGFQVRTALRSASKAEVGSNLAAPSGWGQGVEPSGGMVAFLG